jgi:hypothetical protein
MIPSRRRLINVNVARWYPQKVCYWLLVGRGWPHRNQPRCLHFEGLCYLLMDEIIRVNISKVMCQNQNDFNWETDNIKHYLTPNGCSQAFIDAIMKQGEHLLTVVIQCVRGIPTYREPLQYQEYFHNWTYTLWDTDGKGNRWICAADEAMCVLYSPWLWQMLYQRNI